MKKALSKGLGILLLCSLGVAFAFGMNAWERAAKRDGFDARLEKYNPEGDFIMIDSQEGLMGIYNPHTPLTHIWEERLKNVKPGLYRYKAFEDLIELSSTIENRVYHLYLWETGLECIREKVAQDTPVFVF